MAPRKRVKVIRPNRPDARDEGPRLLPLPEEKPEQHNSKLRHYMKLADIALGTKKKE